MAMLVVLCLMLWSGILPAPFDPGFSSAQDDATPVVQPCPPSDATTVDLTKINVNVYNGTDTAGLAGSVTSSLTAAGITVKNTADWPKGSYDGDVELTTSAAGLTNAYSLARIFTGTVVIQIDETQKADDKAVSVVLGSQYKSTIMSTEEIGQVKSGQTITAPAQCQQVTSTAAATAQATK